MQSFRPDSGCLRFCQLRGIACYPQTGRLAVLRRSGCQVAPQCDRRGRIVPQAAKEDSFGWAYVLLTSAHELMVTCSLPVCAIRCSTTSHEALEPVAKLLTHVTAVQPAGLAATLMQSTSWKDSSAPAASAACRRQRSGAAGSVWRSRSFANGWLAAGWNPTSEQGCRMRWTFTTTWGTGRQGAV